MRISDWSSDVCSSDLILETISIAILAATRGRRPMFGAAARKDKAMIDIRKFDSLGHADHGWLDARHHFSFAGYHDPDRVGWGALRVWRSEEHTSELQSLMRISYAVFCLKKKKTK